MLSRPGPNAAAAAAVLAAVILGAGSSRAQGVSRACTARNARVVVADARVRLVRVRRLSSGGAAYFPLVACVTGGRRSYALDDPNPEHEGDRAIRVALAGSWVAVATISLDATNTEQFATVRLLNTATGRRDDAVAVSPSVDPSEATVTALVVGRTGAIAWIAVNQAPSAANSGAYEVWLRRPGRAPRRVEADRGVRPRSLALSADGTTVYWMDESGARTAAFGR